MAFNVTFDPVQVKAPWTRPRRERGRGRGSVCVCFTKTRTRRHFIAICGVASQLLIPSQFVRLEALADPGFKKGVLGGGAVIGS